MQENSDFTKNVAKQFCPWCGNPVSYQGFGRPRVFCSDRCRWSFDKYRQSHRELFQAGTSHGGRNDAGKTKR